MFQRTHPPTEKTQWIEDAVKNAGFCVLYCQDDSYQHQGHQGFSDGGSHFTLFIQGSFKTHQERLLAHRSIMNLFQEAIPDTIHALSLKFVAPEDV